MEAQAPSSVQSSLRALLLAVAGSVVALAVVLAGSDWSMAGAARQDEPAEVHEGRVDGFVLDVSAADGAARGLARSDAKPQPLALPLDPPAPLAVETPPPAAAPAPTAAPAPPAPPAPAPAASAPIPAPVTPPPLELPVFTPPPAAAPAPPPTPPPASSPAGGGVEAEFLAGLNRMRADAGLPPLARDGQLDGMAAGWSAEMAASGHLRHSGLIRSIVDSRGVAAGENVGRGGSVGALLSAFAASPGHYQNIVSPLFARVGIATVVAPDGTMWTTHLFSG